MFNILMRILFSGFSTPSFLRKQMRPYLVLIVSLPRSLIVDLGKPTINTTIFAGRFRVSIQNGDAFRGICIRTVAWITDATNFSRAVVLHHRVWDDGIIYYKFSPDLKIVRIFTLITIIDYIQLVTCLRFVYRRTEDNYIYIQEGEGCNSHVGKQGGRQILNLGSRCWNLGIILHELCHAIGFYHEHTRPDRDKYIKILWDNIIDGNKTVFQINRFLKTCGTYSYDSIMHYGPTIFAKDGKITLMPTLPNVTLKEVYDRRFLSESDIECINKLYKCK
ncbi:astacin-like metalloprotease toxin 5 isoform X1 [Centruroides sculpturatus]|uniref:astacin-like metalloprotease toxin 5 isoform X1 n=1 Tax=Centruroides sculpturatus TaxID=218467 RepID=UPI000C6CC987|nr:astacin-like metalloprotease toxin 5 isoform X1 [Centruroides sculpturatus]